MKVLVVSDTHAPRRWKAMPDALRAPLAEADVILHAGDVCVRGVLAELAASAPLHVVLGNNDGPDIAAWPAPERLELELGGVRVAMIHDAGAKAGRARRMRRTFPDADVVVFGHSHIPMDVVEDGVHLFNPGSLTDPRRERIGSYGWLELVGGEVVHHEIVRVGTPPR